MKKCVFVTDNEKEILVRNVALGTSCGMEQKLRGSEIAAFTIHRAELDRSIMLQEFEGFRFETYD